jgi:hypothetical protein
MNEENLVRHHGQRMIMRYNALFRAGYRVAPHWSHDMQLALVHPNKKAPRLALNDDGSITLLFPRSDMAEHEIIDILIKDDRAFDRLIARTPAPNFLQSLGLTTVGRAVETVVALALLGLIWFAASKGLEALFPGLKNLW